MKISLLLVSLLSLVSCEQPQAVDINTLNQAIKNGNAKLVNTLINDVDINQAGADGYTPLITAATVGDVTTGNTLINRGAKINFQAVKEVAPAIYHAAYTGNVEFVKLLIAHGADVNLAIDKTTALMGATGYCHPETVRLLLKHGADKDAIDAFGDTALSSLEPFVKSRREKFGMRCVETVKLLRGK